MTLTVTYHAGHNYGIDATTGALLYNTRFTVRGKDTFIPSETLDEFVDSPDGTPFTALASTPWGLFAATETRAYLVTGIPGFASMRLDPITGITTQPLTLAAPDQETTR